MDVGDAYRYENNEYLYNNMYDYNDGDDDEDEDNNISALTVKDASNLRISSRFEWIDERFPNMKTQPFEVLEKRSPGWFLLRRLDQPNSNVIMFWGVHNEDPPVCPTCRTYKNIFHANTSEGTNLPSIYIFTRRNEMSVQLHKWKRICMKKCTCFRLRSKRVTCPTFIYTCSPISDPKSNTCVIS